MPKNVGKLTLSSATENYLHFESPTPSYFPRTRGVEHPLSSSAQTQTAAKIFPKTRILPKWHRSKRSKTTRRTPALELELLAFRDGRDDPLGSEDVATKSSTCFFAQRNHVRGAASPPVLGELRRVRFLSCGWWKSWQFWRREASSGLSWRSSVRAVSRTVRSFRSNFAERLAVALGGRIVRVSKLGKVNYVHS